MATRNKQGAIVAFMRGHIGGKINSITNGVQNLVPMGVGERAMLEIEYARWDLNSHYLRRLRDDMTKSELGEMLRAAEGA